jgi:hypothetical protein
MMSHESRRATDDDAGENGEKQYLFHDRSLLVQTTDDQASATFDPCLTVRH